MIPNDLLASYIDSTIASTELDKSGQWTLNADKSSKECVSAGNCTFRASFTRPFEGEASADYTITKNAGASYEAYSYAAQYTTGNGEVDRSTLLYYVSEPVNIPLENVAATFAYPESRNDSHAADNLLTISALSVATLLTVLAH